MPASPVFDRYALNGKLPSPERTVEVLVIGAGPAGIAAATEAAKRGAQVLLVDEHPVSASLMGLDTPLYFGGRMTSAVQRQARMVEQLLASSPDLEAAMELGVEVLLGTYAWGAYVNGPGLGTLPAPVVGLADEDRVSNHREIARVRFSPEKCFGAILGEYRQQVQAASAERLVPKTA